MAHPAYFVDLAIAASHHNPSAERRFCPQPRKQSMRYAWFQFVIIPLLIVSASLKADTVRLRDGKTLDGTFVGGSAKQLEFLTSSGQTVKMPIDRIMSVNFSHPAPPPPSESAAPSRKAVMVPAGTGFRVRTIDAIDVDATKAGAKFRASVDDPIMLGGDVIVPRGADAVLVAARVEQGG